MYLGAGDGTFRDVTPPDFTWETFGNEDLVTGIAVGDLNRDGRPDLVVGHHFGSTIDKGEHVPVRIFLNRGNDDSGAPKWDDVTQKAGVPGFATKSPQVEIEDFDNDGLPDVLVTASADDGHTPVILRNNGIQDDTPTFTASDGLGNPQYWVSGGVADVDHDGRLDVFVVEFDATKPSYLFRTTGPSGHWLGVDVGGTAMGGVGSLVQVFKPGAERDPNGLLGFNLDHGVHRLRRGGGADRACRARRCDHGRRRRARRRWADDDDGGRRRRSGGASRWVRLITS